MDRRLIGALVLVLAVVAALAGNGRTKVLPGSAERVPIPGPPAVGSCVTGPFDYSSISYGDSSEPTYATAPTGRCAGERYGEVVAILPTGLDYRPPADAGLQTEPDPGDPWMQCWTKVSAFLGSPTDPMEEPPADEWSPTVSAGPETIAPNVMQFADGQRWLACVAIGFGDGGAVAYRGSLADALTTLKVPPGLAVCLDNVPETDSGGVIVPCDRPHLAEQFASVYPTPDHLEPAPPKADCERLVREMTGMRDPTADGRLRVEVSSVRETMYFSEDGEEPLTGTTGTSRMCLVVAQEDARLTGPLLGLGAGPVPLS